jgi:hypothetical protein
VKPILAAWKQRWEYQSYIERAQGGGKKAEPAKGGANKRVKQ